MSANVTYVHLEECESTIDTCQSWLQRDDVTGVLVVTADHQTRGRGTHGRAWHDQPGSSILLSIAFTTPPQGFSAEAFPATLAQLTVDWVTAQFGEPPDHYALSVKTPNDVFAGSRKLAGVLAQAQRVGADIGWVIASVGVNVVGAEAVIAGRETTSLAAVYRDAGLTHGDVAAQRTSLVTHLLQAHAH